MTVAWNGRRWTLRLDHAEEDIAAMLAEVELVRELDAIRAHFGQLRIA